MCAQHWRNLWWEMWNTGNNIGNKICEFSLGCAYTLISLGTVKRLPSLAELESQN